MKLVRFELKADPGVARAGMLHNGRVYESEEGEAVGVHEAADVRPLSPVGRPPSIRLFSALEERPDEGDASPFVYANPAAVVGPSQLVSLPEGVGPFAVRTYLGAVLADGPAGLDADEADAVLLGYTLVAILSDEAAAAGGLGRAFDAAIVVGPALSTPDEMEDAEAEAGYDLRAVLRVDGVERASRDLLFLRPSLREAVASLSRSRAPAAGDLVAIGPLFDPLLAEVRRGDEVHLAVERLGTLAVKIASFQEEL